MRRNNIVVNFVTSKFGRVLLTIVILMLVFNLGMGLNQFLVGGAVENKQEEIEQLQAENDSLQEELDSVEADEGELEEANDQIEHLQNINNSLQNRIEELEGAIQTTSDNPTTEDSLAQSYVSQKFWQDGNRYQTTGNETVFYSDTDFQNGLENSQVILVSPVVSTDKIQDPDTGEIRTVYSSLSEDGFVYSKDVPYLEPVTTQ